MVVSHRTQPIRFSIALLPKTLRNLLAQHLKLGKYSDIDTLWAVITKNQRVIDFMAIFRKFYSYEYIEFNIVTNVLLSANFCRLPLIRIYLNFAITTTVICISQNISLTMCVCVL